MVLFARQLRSGLTPSRGVPALLVATARTLRKHLRTWMTECILTQAEEDAAPVPYDEWLRRRG